MRGRAALDTISLMDAFGALRSAIRTCISNDGECPYGTLDCVDSSLLERMLGVERTDEAMRMVITQTVDVYKRQVFPSILTHTKEPHLRSSNLNFFSPTIGVRFTWGGGLLSYLQKLRMFSARR